MTLSDAHRSYLMKHAVDPDLAHRLGVRSISDKMDVPAGFGYLDGQGVPSVLYPWRSVSGVEWPQLRPDEPVVKGNGDEAKYLFLPGERPVLWRVHCPASATTVLLIEGTKQALAVASTGPDAEVYALAGCWGWYTDGGPIPDLDGMAEGRDLVVMLDGDVATNPAVWEAATRMKTELPVLTGAKSVQFAPAIGSKDTNLDDILAKRVAGERLPFIRRLITGASAKLPGKPAGRRLPANVRKFFDASHGSFLPMTTARHLDAQRPFAFHPDSGAMFRYDEATGTYQRMQRTKDDSTGVGHLVADLLGDQHLDGYTRSVSGALRAHIYAQGRILDTEPETHLVAVRNGVLDPTTGALRPHSPDNLLMGAWAVEYDPDAECPRIMAYLHHHFPDQVDAVLDTMARVLDRKNPQDRVLYLFGPPRTGKSTLLAVLTHMVGPDAYKAIGLHELVTNRFAVAGLFGKALNAAAELNPEDVRRTDIFKRLTGGDPVEGEYKYHDSFTFVSHAFLAFAANSVPGMPVEVEAEMARIVPVYAPRSFVGREDPAVLDGLLEELPGLLAKLVRRFQRRANPEPLDVVRREFFMSASRIARFVHDRCTPLAPEEPDVAGETATDVYTAFKTWANDNEVNTGLGRNRFYKAMEEQGYPTKKSGVQRFRLRLREGDGDTGGGHDPGFLDWLQSLGCLGSSEQVGNTQETKEEGGDGGGASTPGSRQTAQTAQHPHHGPATTTIDGLGSWSSEPSVLSRIAGRIAIDVETTGLGEDLQVRTVQLAGLTGSGDVVGVFIDIETDPAAVEVVNRVLAECEGRLYSFGSFDARAVRLDGRLRDTRIIDGSPLAHWHSPVAATQSDGLKDLMGKQGLAAFVTHVTAEQTLTMSTTDPAFVRYAMTDSLALARLMEKWAPLDDTVERWLARENRIGDVARGMTERGVRVSRDRLAELEVLYSSQREGAEAAAKDHEPDVTNLASPKQVIGALQRRGVELPDARRKRKDGTVYSSPSTSRKYLKSDDPFALAVQRYRSKHSAVTYVRGLTDAADDNDRVHTRWKPLGARTSRWASSGPNLQNVAKHGEHIEVRSAFVPAPGCVFVQADLSQIEYRVAAALSGDPGMLKAFHEGGDLHVYAARVLNGVDKPTKEQRDAAKGIGFGKLYGQTVQTAARDAKVSVAEMRERVDRYDATFPVLAEWCRETQDYAAAAGRSPTSPFGRSFPVPGAHAGVNYLCQSTARELFVDWVLAVDEAFPGALVLAVHDEVVLEVPAADGPVVAERVAALAAEANTKRPTPLDRVSIVAEGAVAEHDWMQAYG